MQRKGDAESKSVTCKSCLEIATYFETHDSSKRFCCTIPSM